MTHDYDNDGFGGSQHTSNAFEAYKARQNVEILTSQKEYGDKAYEKLKVETDTRIRQLEDGLRSIADSKYCNYEVMKPSDYGRGLVDGHRYCANVAQETLSKTSNA